MQISRNMAKIIAIATIVVIASVSLMSNVTITPVQAQLAAQQPVSGALPAGATANVTVVTIPYLSYRPNPVGTGQPVLINIWMQPALPVTRQFVDAFIVTFTKPDGTTDKIGPITSYLGDTTAWFEYTVDQVGTWAIKLEFLGTYFPAGRYFGGKVVTNTSGTVYDSAYYKPSTTENFELIVHSEQVMSWPPAPLPTDYWTRPISPENREWWVIAGHYPFTGRGGAEGWPANTNAYASNYKFTPYVQAPNTAHIAWKRLNEIGGLVGGQFGQSSFYTGGGFGTTTNIPNLIFIGRVYQTITKPMPQLINGTYRTVPTSVWECYDLRTGKVYWDLTDVTAPTAIFNEPPVPEVAGAVSDWRENYRLVAISGGRLLKYEPITGSVSGNYSISPLTTGTIYKDEFVLSVQTLGTGANTTYRLINWTMAGSSNDITTRIRNNITYPFSALGTCDFEAGIAVSTLSYSPNATGVATELYVRGASLTTGQLLYNVSAGVGLGLFSGSTAVADHGKFAVRFNDGHWYCWDLYSGKQLWKSELSSYPWGTFGAYTTASAYGLIYSNAYDGISGINWTNGKIEWTFNAPTPYPYETPYEGVYPWFSSTGVRIADGKLYANNNEHTMSQPMYRGLRLFCMDAITGENIWNITGYMPPAVVADGYLAAAGMYDGELYVFGKGKSATTVTGSPKTIANGAKVLIEGTVLDQSPAQPNTPCVSKESMTAQMEYLHMQHPIDGVDHNVQMTGVPVVLTAIDSNGNGIDIGTAITSAYCGTYEIAWTPPAEGTYKIIASFAGDDSYGSSAASTALSVGPTPATPETPQTIVPDYTMTIIGGVIAIIIAVVIAVAVAVLILRKR